MRDILLFISGHRDKDSIPCFIQFLGPVSSAVPAYTARMKGDYELSSAINSFSILISILLIVAVLLFMA